VGSREQVQWIATKKCAATYLYTSHSIAGVTLGSYSQIGRDSREFLKNPDSTNGLHMKLLGFALSKLRKNLSHQYLQNL